MKILCIAGARPNFMKIAPIMRAFPAHAPGIEVKLVHTGQHYDVEMNELFFRQLDIPEPDITLEVGSATHAVQTAEIMRRFEPVLDAEKPDAIIVVGDVNSTIACALVAAKNGVHVFHVEAGLRSRDRSMPEEINRVLTDQLSDLLFTTEQSAESNLRAEGIAPERIRFVGNVMIDTLLHSRPRAIPVDRTIRSAGHDPAVLASGHALLTLHRPANVDDTGTLKSLVDTLLAASRQIPIIFPVHPRTDSRLRAAGLAGLLEGSRLLRLPPVGYLEMVGLLDRARLVLTDSGGLQEEATALGIPCLTLRENTERPVTVELGTNTVVGRNPATILEGVASVLAGRGKAGRIPPLWDGRAAERIVTSIVGTGEDHASARAAPKRTLVRA